MKNLTNLIYKKADGTSSSSKFWFSAGNGVILYTYLLLGHKLAQSEAPNYEGWALLTLVVAAILTGNKLLNDLIKLRFGAGAQNGATSKSDSTGIDIGTDSSTK